MTTRLAYSAARVAVNAMTKRLDAGRVRIYTSSQPSDVAASAHGTLLVSANLGTVAFVSARDGNPNAICSANGIALVSAVTSGKAGWFRALTSGGTAWMDGLVTTAGSSGQMIVNNTDVEQDQPFTITSWLITQPES